MRRAASGARSVTNSSPIALSDPAEHAVAKLAAEGCDGNQLRLLVTFAHQIPDLLPTRRLDAIMRGLAGLERDLEELRVAYDGWYLFPPLGHPTELSEALKRLEVLKAVLESWRDARRKKRVHPRTYWRIGICAYVRHRTGAFYDDEVAVLWSEIEPDAGANGGVDASAVGHFRQDHRQLLDGFLKRYQLVDDNHRPPSSPPREL